MPPKARPAAAGAALDRSSPVELRAPEIVKILTKAYPNATVALRFSNPLEMLFSTILSAQTTDERVNLVTPSLFARYPGPHDLAAADPGEVEELIRPTGFFRAKTRSLVGMAQAVVERYGGQVPSELDDLVTLPGVGRKTANVVRSVGFDAPGLPVDTHVGRLTRRLCLTTETDPVKVEQAVGRLVPPAEWGALSLRLILHGRAVCRSRKPRCDVCVLNDFCPSAFAT
jgi:endonuclease-3